MNVLWITADQWRGDCLSSAGHPCVRTPALDMLAAEGTRFARHFTQATPCGPARASLHTGMYAMNHRSVTNGTPLDARHTDLAAEVRKAGYAPTLFGYTDLSHDPRGLASDDPRLRGYEGVYESFEIGLDLNEDGVAWLGHLERRYGGTLRLQDLYRFPLGEPAPYAANDSDTAFLTDSFLEHLNTFEEERPWFAHLSYLRPHPPWVAPSPYHALYDLDEVPGPVRAPSPEAEAELHPWIAARMRQPQGQSWWDKPQTLHETEIRRARAIYFGLISEVDRHLGRVLEALKARGDLDRTFVIFTADHGEMLGDHWLLGKGGFFKEAFHVPLIIRDPTSSAARGQVVEAFTEHVDLMPTILERLGIEPPRQCDGASLIPLLEGRTPPGWRTAAHYEHDFRDLETLGFERELRLASERCALAVHHGERFIYVHFNGLPPLCFDLEQDPHQLRSIACEPDKAMTVLEQAQSLLSWRMDHAERRLTGCKLTPSGVIGAY